MRSAGLRRCVRRSCAPAVWLVLSVLGACGDDGGGGAAGAPAEPGMLGEPCAAGCDTGLICARDGALAGLCTVGCTNQQSCQLLAPGTRASCFGQVNAQCALGCDGAEDCPAGTVCAQVSGAMACTAMR